MITDDLLTALISLATLAIYVHSGKFEALAVLYKIKKYFKL